MSTQTITCPHCRQSFALDDVLTHELEENLKKQYEAKEAEKIKEFAEKEEQLREQRKNLETAQKEQEVFLKQQAETIRLQLEHENAETLRLEKNRLSEAAKEAASREKEDEVKFLTEKLQEKETKLDEARKAELTLRKEKLELEENKKAFELEKQRQIDEDRKKIEEETARKMQEVHHLKDAEKDKKISDMQAIIEDLQRKAQQGSQQTQGEVLELELEELLRTTFPHDEIVPVGKGVHGADIIQQVKSPLGRPCGTIVWESKHTKNWNDAWLQKLKDDRLNQKAEIAVIVSVALPDGIKNFGQRDGVWVTDMTSVLGLALALRLQLIEVARAKFSLEDKQEKMGMVYTYLSGSEFRQRVEAIVESFQTMKLDLEKEKAAYTKMWAKREKQIERVVTQTIGMHGDLEGLMGSALPQIKMLELPSGDEFDEASPQGML